MTKQSRIIAVIVIVFLQMIFFAGWYASEQDVFKKPIQKILVKTESYDPRDLLSGQYIRLAYSFTNTWGRWDPQAKATINPEWAKEINNYSVSTKNKKEIWVVLHQVSGFYEPKIASYDKPENLSEGEVAIRGKKDNGRITYGIEKFFVPEGTKEPKREDTTVELNVYDKGIVRINKVYVSGKEWP